MISRNKRFPLSALPKRKSLSASLYDSLIRTRSLLCLLLFLYSFLDPHIKSRNQLWILIALYVIFNFCLRLFFSPFLHLKRVRVIPALADVVFISLIILNSTGPGNSWFLFYLFPIIDVSRY